MLFLVLFLPSCASQPYWVKTSEPVVPTGERIVSISEFWGEFDRQTGATYISEDAPEWTRPCIRLHEAEGDLSHAKGYDHLLNRTGFIDCGDGTWISYEALRGK